MCAGSYILRGGDTAAGVITRGPRITAKAETRHSTGGLWPNKGSAKSAVRRGGSVKVESTMEHQRVVAVVEDEATIREAVCFALRREGYAADAFDDGLNAWEAFGRKLPDVA